MLIATRLSIHKSKHTVDIATQIPLHKVKVCHQIVAAKLGVLLSDLADGGGYAAKCHSKEGCSSLIATVNRTLWAAHDNWEWVFIQSMNVLELHAVKYMLFYCRQISG